MLDKTLNRIPGFERNLNKVPSKYKPELSCQVMNTHYTPVTGG
jgi:hypothetical protein